MLLGSFLNVHTGNAQHLQGGHFANGWVLLFFCTVVLPFFYRSFFYRPTVLLSFFYRCSTVLLAISACFARFVLVFVLKNGFIFKRTVEQR